MSANEKSVGYPGIKLTEHNYTNWVVPIEAALDKKRVLGVVLGTETKPVAPTLQDFTDDDDDEDQSIERYEIAVLEYDRDLESYNRKVRNARFLLLTSISESVMSYVKKAKDSPAEIWSILEKKYNPKTETTALTALMESYSRCATEGEDVEAYIQKLVRLREKLEEQDEPISDRSFNGVLLNGIAGLEDYSMTVKILQKTVGLTAESAINSILEDYGKLKRVKTSPSSSPSLSSGAKAFSTFSQRQESTRGGRGGFKGFRGKGKFGHGRGNFSGRGISRNSMGNINRNSGHNSGSGDNRKVDMSLRCDFCNMRGHLRDQCFKELWYKQQKISSTSKPTGSHSGGGTIAGQHDSGAVVPFDHWRNSRNQRSSSYSSYVACVVYFAATISAPSPNVWMLDSCCNACITPFKQRLQGYVEFDHDKFVVGFG